MIKRILANLSRATPPRFPLHLVQHPDHQAAAAFMRDMQVKDGIGYGWVNEYAQALWEDRNKTFAVLDEKADSIIKYLGAGMGVFVLGILAKIDVHNAYLALSALPAVLSAVASVYTAIRARNPAFTPNLPSVESAKGYAEAEGNEEQARAAFLGQWHLACEDLRLVNEKKAALVARAGGLYFVALLLLLIPAGVASFHPPKGATSSAATVEKGSK
jgi:hypothetical protein